MYCGQTVGRIKIKLGVHVGLGPGHIVLDGDPAPPSQRGTAPTPPQFSAHICCGQMPAWIKMPLCTEVGLGPGDFVLDADSTHSLSKKGAEPPHFRPMFIVAKRVDGSRWTWHGGRPQPRRLCVRWRPSPLPKKGRTGLPNFRPVSIVAKRLHGSRCHLVQR